MTAKAKEVKRIIDPALFASLTVLKRLRDGKKELEGQEGRMKEEANTLLSPYRDEYGDEVKLEVLPIHNAEESEEPTSITVSVTKRAGRRTINPNKLLEKGVDPATIEYATEVGNPSESLDIR